MTITPATLPLSAAEIPAATALGAVHLTVANLSRSVAFYERDVGLDLRWRDDPHAALGAGGQDLVVLKETPGARPARGVAGLFHSALLLPERADLARWLIHAVQNRVTLSGLSDHFVSEAVYLDDPDGHGIEIYADRPRQLWEGQVAQRIVVEPLDTGALMATLHGPVPTAYTGMPPGTRTGHVHLRVGDLRATAVFYRDVLGFAPMGTLGSAAAFFGAGGYHHHFGVNVWSSAGASAAPPEIATLLKATIVLPDSESLDRTAARVRAVGGFLEPTTTGVLVRDPSGLALELQMPSA